MDIKQAIQVLIKAALAGRYNDLERLTIDQAVELCSQLEIATKEETPLAPTEEA